MTKYDMVVKIAIQTGVDQTQTKLVVQMALDGITDILVREGRFELRDFGVFEVLHRKSRTGRNPKTSARLRHPRHVQKVGLTRACSLSFRTS